MSDSCQFPIVKLSTISDVIMHSTEQSQMETSSPQSVSAIPIKQADNDEQLIALWIHGRSKHTQRAYKRDIEHFRSFTPKSFREIKLADIQAFETSLIEQKLEQSSINRTLAAVKSLFLFAHRIGYLAFDVGRPVKLTSPKDTLAERILSENEIHRIIEAEHNPRNKLILKFLYVSVVRVSELCSLKWKDLQEREDGGQVTIYGKGNKTRTILLPQSFWNKLMIFRNISSDEQPVFRSRKGGHLCPSQVLRIVKKAGVKAGIAKSICNHTFRHCHSSHSLDNHSPIHILQACLGHASLQTTSRYLHTRPSDSSSKYLKDV